MSVDLKHRPVNGKRRKSGWKTDLVRKSQKNPVWWIENVLGDSLWHKQEEISQAIVDHQRVAVPACFSDDTEILTEFRGWQLFNNLLLEDKVASLVDGVVKFVQPENYYSGHYTGTMLGAKSRQIDFLVTPNHRCYVKQEDSTKWMIKTAEEIENKSLFFNNTINYNTKRNGLYKDDDNFIKVDRKDWRSVPYDGKVYCVQVPSGIILVRRNGLYHWSGNSFGVGKCMALDEEVQLLDGQVVKAKDLIDKSFHVLAFDDVHKQQVPAQAWAFDNGTQPVYKITVQSGKSIIRTGNHPLYQADCEVKGDKHYPVFPNWVPVEKLKSGDFVALPAKLEIEGDLKVPDKDIKLLAHNLINNNEDFPDWAWKLDNGDLIVLLKVLFFSKGFVSYSFLDNSVSLGIQLYTSKLNIISWLLLRFGICGNVYNWVSEGEKSFWWCGDYDEIVKLLNIVGHFSSDLNDPNFKYLLNKLSKKPKSYLNRLGLGDDFIWDRVVEVEYLGEQPTVAISVPNYHTYITQFVEHNTFLAARLCLWFLFNHKPARVVTCYDDETEILTETRGFKLFKDLDVNEKVATLEEGNLVFRVPEQHYCVPYEGEMVEFSGQDLNFKVTPNHRCYVKSLYKLKSEWGIEQAGDIFKKARVFNKQVIQQGIPNSFSEEQFEFWGFWLADGSLGKPCKNGNYGVVRISQKSKVDYILELAKKVYKGNIGITPDKRNDGLYDIRIFNTELATFLAKNFGVLKKDRTIPNWIMQSEPNKLRKLIKGFFHADGCIKDNSFEESTRRVVSIYNKNLAESIYEASVRAGFVANLHFYQHLTKGFSKQEKLIDRWSITLFCDHKNNNFPTSKKKSSWKKSDYKGNIYCVKVPSGIVLVRRKGIFHWSGNTAPGLRQVKDLLWSEIRSAHKKAKMTLGGTPLQLRLDLNEMQYAVGFSTDDTNIDMFTGYHAPNQLVVFDQAGGIPKNVWIGAEGLMTSANCRWLVISNTAISDGVFADICIPGRKHDHGKWKIIPITARETPNVLAGKNIIEGLTSFDYIEKQEKIWAPDDPLYRIFINAEFVPAVEMTVIPYPYTEPAWNYEGALSSSIEIGLDVARSGTDSTVWFARSGSRALRVRRVTGNNTMEVVGHTIEFVRQVENDFDLPVSSVKVDEIGLGAGVFDRLQEQDLSFSVVPVNNAERKTVTQRDRFFNIRSEMAWELRRLFEHGQVGLAVCDFENESIKQALQADINIMKYRINSQGLILLWSKDEIRPLLGRSPDYWDAMVMAYTDPGAVGVDLIEFISSVNDKNEMELSAKVMTDDEWLQFIGQQIDIDDKSFVDVE